MTDPINQTNGERVGILRALRPFGHSAGALAHFGVSAMTAEPYRLTKEDLRALRQADIVSWHSRFDAKRDNQESVIRCTTEGTVPA